MNCRLIKIIDNEWVVYKSLDNGSVIYERFEEDKLYVIGEIYYIESEFI